MPKEIVEAERTDDEEVPAGELLIGAEPIRKYLVDRGMPETTDPYYLKRSGWPIGGTSANGGGKLAATKRQLNQHLVKITRGPSAA